MFKKNKKSENLSKEAAKYMPTQPQAAPPKPAAPGPAAPAGQEKPHKGAEGNDFKTMKENWNKDRKQITQASLLRMFDTDDDMAMAQHLLLIAITAFFIVFMIWANLATLDEIARGEGKVIPSSDVQVIQTLDAGIVDEFLVKEGEQVKIGQTLMRLSDIEASSDLGANQSRYLGLLAAITRLQAESEGKATVDFPDDVMKGAPSSVTEEMNAFRANRTQVTSQTSVLQQQRSQREQEVREIEGRIADIRAVIALQEEEKAMIAPLIASGSAPKMELLQLDRALREKNAELNSAQSSLPRARSAVNEASARINEITSTSRAQAQTELSAKFMEMNEIKERLSALKSRKERTELTSPVNGTIQEIAVKTVGGVVRPGDPIIKIIPNDDQLIVEARIKPSDRAFIYPTQKAVVKITAYDFSIYGGLKAEVLDISADTVEDEKKNHYYRVRLRTEQTELKRKGQVLPIIPGMVASVDIITGKKTIIQYLMKPLIKTLDIAMSER